MRATFSPGMARNCSPAASSVVSISDNAVDNHAAAGRPERFLNPSTATVRRPVVDAGTTALPLVAAVVFRRAMVHCQYAAPAATEAMTIAVAATSVVLRRRQWAAAPSSAACTAPACSKRRVGSRSRQRSTTDFCAAWIPVRSGGIGRSPTIAAMSSRPFASLNGRSPAAIS